VREIDGIAGSIHMMPRMSTRPLVTGRMPWTAGALPSLPSRRSLRPFALWLLVLAAGIALLYGRFDWDPGGGRFAERGFLLSVYLFLILLPTCFYLARRILHSTAAAAVLTGFVFTVTTLPWELLGLDQFYYLRERPPVFPSDYLGPPSLEFFPEGTLRAFPYDYLFWPLLFAGGLAAIWGVWWFRNRTRAVSRRLPVLLSVAFAAICLQASVHTSMRAPYTYLAYFQFPKSEQHWYHVYNFPDRSGAAEADQYAYYPMEDYFQGAPRDGHNMLARRPFSFYLAAQGSYFVNTFYVWLGLNCLFWLAAVVATGRLVGRLTTERAGVIAGAMTAVGPGFVAFVGTPAMYLQSYAAVAIVLCLFEDLVVRTGGRSRGSVALFTGVLALCALVYDFAPLFLVLLAYGLARAVRPLPLVCSLVAAFVASLGYSFVITDVLGITINPQNSGQIGDAFGVFKSELLHPSLASWYDHTVSVIPGFLRLLLQAFFVLPVLIAVLALRKLRDRPLQVLVAGLFAMAFAIVAFFDIGEALYLQDLPRLVYYIFPAVYLLAALALDPGEPDPQHSALPARHRIPAGMRRAAPWVVVGMLFVLSNIDIFGYPTLYVEFFVSDPPVFLPN
jgi:hypothetical protein